MSTADINALVSGKIGMKVLPNISEFDHDPWNGRLLMWEPREAGELYAIGVDPAEGVGQDNSVCQVLKIGNVHHPDVQVAEFACNYLDPTDFAGVVKTIGQFYADPDGTPAFCTVECNAPCGDVMINDLRARLDYDNLFIWKEYDKINNVYTNKYGFWTNKTTRPKLIAKGLHAFMYSDLIVNSDYLLAEMADFQRDLLLAKARAVSGKHDDRIMAILIAYWGAHDEEWLMGEDVAEQRRLREARAKVQKHIESRVDVPKPKADYQSRPITAAEMARLSDQLFSEEF